MILKVMHVGIGLKLRLSYWDFKSGSQWQLHRPCVSTHMDWAWQVATTIVLLTMYIKGIQNYYSYNCNMLIHWQSRFQYSSNIQNYYSYNCNMLIHWQSRFQYWSNIQNCYSYNCNIWIDSYDIHTHGHKSETECWDTNLVILCYYITITIPINRIKRCLLLKIWLHVGYFSYVSTSATVQTVVKAVTIVIVNIFRGSQLLEEVGGLV